MSASWEAVIDAQMDLRRWLTRNSEGWGALEPPVDPDGTVHEWLRANRTQPDILLAADPVYVSAEVATLVTHAEATFQAEPLSESDLLIPSAFAVIERPLTAELSPLAGLPMAAVSWSVTQSPDGRAGVLWTVYMTPEHPDGWGAPYLPFFDSTFWAFGERDSPGGFTRWLQCLWRFMLQTITEVAPAQPSRGVRRRLEKARWTQRNVQVVTLRRRRLEQPESGSTADVEYTCRWLVQGHWRNHWFPSQDDHRQIWIDPYVKGPEGAPFKKPCPRAVMVSR